MGIFITNRSNDHSLLAQIKSRYFEKNNLLSKKQKVISFSQQFLNNPVTMTTIQNKECTKENELYSLFLTPIYKN